jgi:hypothetical protein
MRHHKGIQALGLGMFLAVQVAACANLDAGARRDQAWSERLTRQAEAVQQAAAQRQRSDAAWAERYARMANAYQVEKARAQRADAAYSQRMTKLAEYILGGEAMD